MSTNPVSVPETDKLEHEDLTAPETKRVLVYGWDGSQKVRLSADPGGGLSDPALITYVDEASATITYVGEAVPGTATSAALWRIKRIDTSSGTNILYAAGASAFDQVWDDRAGLSYS